MNRHLAYIIMMALTAGVIYLLAATEISKGVITGLFGASSYYLGYFSKRDKD